MRDSSSDPESLRDSSSDPACWVHASRTKSFQKVFQSEEKSLDFVFTPRGKSLEKV